MKALGRVLLAGSPAGCGSDQPAGAAFFVDVLISPTIVLTELHVWSWNE
jgi:hypothetical protein